MLRGTLIVMTLGALLLAPAASAQDPPETPPLATYSITLSASPSNDPITPITGLTSTNVSITVTCEQASIQPGTEPVVITYSANATHPDATVVTSKASGALAFTPDGCLQGMDLTDTVEVTVSVDQDAPAGEIVTIDFTATLDDGTVESMGWDHPVGHYFNSQVRVEESTHQDAPGATIDVPGTIENAGNADVTYTFALLPDDARRLDVTMPDPVTVPAFDEGTFSIMIKIPPSDSAIDRQDSVVFQVTPALVSDSSITDDPVQNSIVVRTQGGAEESPAPALPFLVVLGAALWAGRRRTCSTVRP